MKIKKEFEDHFFQVANYDRLHNMEEFFDLINSYIVESKEFNKLPKEIMADFFRNLRIMRKGFRAIYRMVNEPTNKA